MFSRNATVTVATIILGILVFGSSGKANAQQVCFANSPEGPAVAYEDLLLPGWSTTGSWGVSIIQQAGPGGQHGTYALGAQFLSNWSGIEFHRENVITTFLDSLIFRIRVDAGNPNIYVTVRKTATNTVGTWVPLLPSYLVPNASIASFTPQQWYSVRVPLADMGLATGASSSFSGIILESSIPATVYFDDVAVIPALSLAFPLHYNNWTPDTATIASVFDHTMTKTYASDSNLLVTAWTGEKGDGIGYPSDPTCKKQQSGQPFVANGYYSGASSCGGSTYLSYDGHPGIDYPAPFGTEVYAAESGVVVFSTANNTNDCPTNGDPCTNYGAIKIKHLNGYQSWYLHLSRQAGGLTNGVSVSKGQLIGYVGHTAPYSIGDHLHFEIRDDHNVPLDPYGWIGAYEDPYRAYHPVFNIRLWEH